MIKNAKQFGVSKQQVIRLQKALELSMEHPAEMDKRIYEAMIAGIKSQIQDLQKEIDEYEKLQKDKDIPVGTLENIGELLIKARIACGYTHKQLADKVGIKPQVIQKYEMNEYKTISLARLEKITNALGVNGMIELVLQKDCLIKENILGVWNSITINPESDIPIEVSYSSNWSAVLKKKVA